GLAGEAGAIDGQGEGLRGEERRAVGALERHFVWIRRHRPMRHRLEPVRHEIGAGQHGEHTPRCPPGRRVGAHDARMGVRRADHRGVRLAGKVNVVRVTPGAGDQARILPTTDGLADAFWRRARPRGDKRHVRYFSRGRRGEHLVFASGIVGPRSHDEIGGARVTRIASVKTHPISVPLTDVLWTAHEELKASSVIVVEVCTDDGLTGYGQIHGSPMKAICAWVERFGEIIRGMDALAHVLVWDRLFSLTCPRPGGIGGADGLPPPLPRGERPQIMAAIGGIDIALWDIKGKHAGLPVWRLLGGEKRPIPTYATGGYYRPGAPDKVYAEELAGFVKAGYRAVKLKTGAGSPQDEAKRVRTVRDVIGKDISLMLDMNAPY